MSRRDEDRILHGLHYYRESIDEEFRVTSEQIVWLAAHSYKDGASWYRDGALRSFDCSIVPEDLRTKLLMSKFEVPLRYLQFRRLIKYTRSGDDSAMVAVTFAGADRAMRLHTRLGRLELWYHERKEGFVGLAVTVAVACITALLTVLLVERLREGGAEAPRLVYPRPLYESRPGGAP